MDLKILVSRHGRSRSFWEKEIAAGRLRAKRIRGRWMTSEADWEAWYSSQDEEPRYGDAATAAFGEVAVSDRQEVGACGKDQDGGVPSRAIVEEYEKRKRALSAGGAKPRRKDRRKPQHEAALQIPFREGEVA